MGVLVAITGLVISASASLHALWLIPREAVPEDQTGHRVGLAGGAVIAWVGVAFRPVIVTVAAALLATVIAGLHLRTLGDSVLPALTPAVVVGQPMPELTLLTERGDPVSSASFRGQRLLLKVFRGHW